MTYRGVAYYPEVWPEERYETDIAWMAEAGINLVRMGEFAWSRMEPADGRFDLGWLVSIVERFAARGIRSLLCTPSAAPPAWLTAAAPETLLVDETGRRLGHGGRQQYCPTNPRYREYVVRIDRRLAAAFAGNPAVVGWQISNELAPGPGFCYCDGCTRLFRAWLRRRYGSVARLNEAWGTGFWSGDFSSFEEVAPPYPRPSWRLDYARFQNEALIAMAADEAAALKEADPSWITTSNQWSGIAGPLDLPALFSRLDVASRDAYWDYYGSRERFMAEWDLYRNLTPRRSFWVTETNAWNRNTAGENTFEALRPWAYEALAAGSEAHIYFRWRMSVMGEEDHPAVLNWTGKRSRAYGVVKRLFTEMRSLAERTGPLPPPAAETAIVQDYDTGLYSWLSNGPAADRLTEADALLRRRNASVDMLSASAAAARLSAYRLVVLPFLEMVDPDLEEALAAFVEGGGILLSWSRLACRDRNGKYRASGWTERLRGLFGVDPAERWTIENRPRGEGFVFPAGETGEASVPVSLRLPEGPCACRAVGEMEEPEIVGAPEILGSYEGGFLKGAPVLAEARRGRGRAIYLAARLALEGAAAVVDHAARLAGIPAPPWEEPPCVEVLLRGACRFYLNHGPRPATVALRAPGEVLVGTAAEGVVGLGPYGVCVVEERPVAG